MIKICDLYVVTWLISINKAKKIINIELKQNNNLGKENNSVFD